MNTQHTNRNNEQYEVVGPADAVLAVAGEDVILPCSVKPNISVVDMRVEWFRLNSEGSQVHLYDNHEDRNTDQSQSYRGRTKLNHQELQRGNTSLKLSSVRVSDEGLYKCFIQSKSWYDDATVNVRVEAVGRPPVITVDGFDHSGGLHLQCESEGWNPEPDLEWLNSEGISLSSETTEMQRKIDGFSVKHTITVHERDSKIHCRFKLKHHMRETLMITTSNMFNSWRTSVILISVFVVLSVIAGILIAVFAHKNEEHIQLQREHSQLQNEHSRLQDEKRRIQHERDQLLKTILPIALIYLKTDKVNVILDADTAHPQLIVSDDGKQVRSGNTQKKVDGGKDRFTEYLGVVGKDGFSSGCFYFEVQVKEQTKWDLGVTRESVNRKGLISLSPDNGYWTVGLRNGKYSACDSSVVSLSLSVDPQRVGVFVNYEKGLVCFYDVESMSHIYTYTDQCFNEKLYPFVSLGYMAYWWNVNSTPLIICDDY
ncbi:butyrophilin subfamily 1 member A1-like [Labeo rohita]|uniref:butyrophilin subfamily 1 member A1-like n=1 Tax=Labeo rohita TaxID=84645 RepID=UPI0021E31768|nr:butyrophilin subfamily 1 member A1-like [Labeo rohita]